MTNTKQSSNNNNFLKQYKTQKYLFSEPKNNSKKTRTTTDLPSINIPNLNSVNLKNEKTKKSNTHKIIKSSSTKKIYKNQSKLDEIIIRRYNMFDKTLNKLKKPLFINNFDKKENNYNNINIINNIISSNSTLFKSK